MKTTIIETLLLILIIITGGILYTLDKNTQEDTALQQYIDTHCKHYKEYTQTLAHDKRLLNPESLVVCGTIFSSHPQLFITKTHRK